MGRSPKKDAQDAAPRDLGRYRLHGEIAAGGMATVHFGRLVGTGGFAKTVAIKRLYPQFATVPEFVTMFLAEARLAARVRHPNVVPPSDVFQVEDEIFLVMEYVEGDSLARLLKATVARNERAPRSASVSIMCGMLHGLHAAHEAKNDQGEPLGLVHRDISPQNVLVGVDGIARVIDFGIAKAADSVLVTKEGELKGKLSYMAPEQLSSGKVTRKVDIYAASVVLWELLTGQRLFDAEYQQEILKKILDGLIDPPSRFVPDISPDLDEIVLRGLSRNQDHRFETAREMALALEDLVVLANPSQVGAWVETVARPMLEKRAERLSQIERLPYQREPGHMVEVVSDLLVPDPGSRSATDQAVTRPRPRDPAPVARASGHSQGRGAELAAPRPPAVPAARQYRERARARRQRAAELSARERAAAVELPTAIVNRGPSPSTSARVLRFRRSTRRSGRRCRRRGPSRASRRPLRPRSTPHRRRGARKAEARWLFCSSSPRRSSASTS